MTDTKKEVQRKNVVISLRVTTKEKNLIKQKASEHGIKISELLINSALNIPLPPPRNYDIEVQESVEKLTLDTYKLLLITQELLIGDAKNQVINTLKDLAENLQKIGARIYQP